MCPDSRGILLQVRGTSAGKVLQGQWKISRLQKREILLVERFPNLFLSKLALDSLLASTRQLTGQGFVAEKLGYRFRECGCITHREKKSGLAIHNGVYDPSRSGGHHWFAGGLGLQNNIGKAFPVAGENEDIHQRIVRGGVFNWPILSSLIRNRPFAFSLLISRQDHMRMRF